jgi:hypothetical protein
MTRNSKMPDLTLAEPLDFDFDAAQFGPAPAEMQEFVRQVIDQAPDSGVQQRGRSRYQIAIEVPAIESDEDLRPLGEPFIAMSRDISTGGRCLVHTHRVASDRWLIRLDHLNSLQNDSPADTATMFLAVRNTRREPGVSRKTKPNRSSRHRIRQNGISLHASN